jgi:hypothetical protein
MTKSSQRVPPVLVIGFNRPDFTQAAFEALRSVKPRQLFFAVDGPRNQAAREASIVSQVQSAVSLIDWDCEVRTLFRTSNLGCKLAVSKAITWFFDNVSAGIILEDDCLPAASFFYFAADLLDRYRDDDRIAMISGDNFSPHDNETKYDYRFSIFPHIWGWASWRRAWQCYDPEMRQWPQVRNGGFVRDLIGEQRLTDYWLTVFDRTYSGQIDTWDFQWTFCCWMNRWLAITPNINLVSNIGCGDGRATNTLHRGNPAANLPRGEMRFPIRHPPNVVRDLSADAITMSKLCWRPSILHRISYRLGKQFRAIQ